MIGAEASYAPGSWVAVTGPGCWLLVESAPTDPIVNRCWTLIRYDADVDAVLDALAAAGIGAAPSFGLLATATGAGPGSAGVRLVVRGGASAEIIDAGGEHSTVRAEPGTTWADRTLAAVPKEIALLAHGRTSGAVGDLMLPLSAGVSMAAAVRIAADDLDAATGNAVPAGVVRREALAAVAPRVVAGDDVVADDVDTDRVDGAAAQVVPPSYDHLFGDTRMLAADVAGEPAGADAAPTGHAADRDGGADVEPVVDAAARAWPTLPAPADGAAVETTSVADEGMIASFPWAEPTNSGRSADAGTSSTGEAAATVSRAALAGMAAGGGAAGPAGPVVLAVRCAAGHLSPAAAAVCRVCHAAVGGQPFEAPQPVLGVLRLSSGDTVPLDRGVLLGRAPDPAAAVGAAGAHVVRLAQASTDVSRTHLEVAVEGWHVLVTDLNSTNGTTVTLPGQELVRLRPGDPLLIEPGTQVNLGGEVEIRYEVVA
jgi:hypothetical protein